MLVVLTRLLLGGAVVLVPSAHAAAQDADTRTEAMPFAECLSLIGEISEQFGVKPASILRTKDVRVVRVDGSDGAVIVTCSRPDNKVILSKRTKLCRTPEC